MLWLLGRTTPGPKPSINDFRTKTLSDMEVPPNLEEVFWSPKDSKAGQGEKATQEKETKGSQSTKQTTNRRNKGSNARAQTRPRSRIRRVRARNRAGREISSIFDLLFRSYAQFYVV